MRDSISRIQRQWQKEWAKVVEGRNNPETNNKIIEIRKRIDKQWEKLGWVKPVGTVLKKGESGWGGVGETEWLVPKSDEEKNIRSLEGAVRLLLAPGVKVIITENRAEMTALALMTNLLLFKSIKREFKAIVKGTATGATTMSLRMLWGLLPYIFLDKKETLKLEKITGLRRSEIEEVLKIIKKVVTLDDYGWTKEKIRTARKTIGWERKVPYTYREEQWTLWKYLLGDREKLVAPVAGKGTVGAMLSPFHGKLKNLVVAAQDWGVGSDGHGGFNEPGYDPLSPDQVVNLNDLTLVQNITGFLRPEEKRVNMIFRNLAAEKQIYKLGELKKEFEKIIGNSKPPEYLMVDDGQWWEIKNNYEKDWEYMLKIIKRIPRKAVTQGVGDSIGRALYCQMLADKPHKARAIANVLEQQIGLNAPGSGLRLAPRVAFILTESSAKYLTNTKNYFYLNLKNGEADFFEDDHIYRLYVARARKQKKNDWQIAAELNEPVETIKNWD